jgi:hypothetical protein
MVFYQLTFRFELKLHGYLFKKGMKRLHPDIYLLYIQIHVNDRKNKQIKHLKVAFVYSYGIFNVL